ncbi:MAG: Lrp/AsnC family transcriptional regulator [Promethearchaeota archaeon]
MVHKKINSINELDNINRKILRILTKDAKASYKIISDELGVSESTIRKRINNLVNSRIIENFTININPKFSKQNITAFITIVPTDGSLNYIVDLLSKQTYCSEIFLLNGRMGLLMIAGVDTAQELDALLETYRINPDIKEVTAGISLRNIKTGNCVAKII